MERIERFVTEQLTTWEVPGCAVAAVRGGRVELTAGWGQRDREASLPVTADTLFAVGSTTKAFTATTVGALVDDGLLEWERPLRDYVPGIRLQDPVVSDRLTVVDLLSHRRTAITPPATRAGAGPSRPCRSGRCRRWRRPAGSTPVPPTWPGGYWPSWPTGSWTG